MSLRLKEKLNIKSSLPPDGVASFIRKTYELLEEHTHADIIFFKKLEQELGLEMPIDHFSLQTPNS